MALKAKYGESRRAKDFLWKGHQQRPNKPRGKPPFQSLLPIQCNQNPPPASSQSPAREQKPTKLAHNFKRVLNVWTECLKIYVYVAANVQSQLMYKLAS